ALLAATRAKAEELGARSVALTFDPHPVRFFKPELGEFRLTTTAQKLERLAAQGMEATLVLPFAAEIARLSPPDFVSHILGEALGAIHVLVGSDFRFGHRRAGTVEALTQLGRVHGFGVTVFEQIRDGASVISSSVIRDAVRDGRVEDVVGLMTHSFELSGPVVHGDARGRTLGYPTANIEVTRQLLPRDGIYTTTLHTPTFGVLPACTYIGKRPTYGVGPQNVETFVLEWERDAPLDLYGQDVTIEFHEFIRSDYTFESSEALTEQMDRDVARARAYFSRA
ncbi:MAG: riboflavin biosynthesis protein RibF, partial [Myxococcota bacterium]